MLGFLQKPQTVTIYVDLANVGSLQKEQIQVDYGKRSLNVVVNNLNGKMYELSLPMLGGEIVPEKCKHKVSISCKLITSKLLSSKMCYTFHHQFFRSNQTP